MGTSSLPSVASPQCLPSVGRVPVCNCGFFSLVFLFTVSPASLRGLRAASKLVCSHFEHSSWFTADVFHLSVCHLSGVRSQLLGRVRPFVTPRTVVRQAPLSMGFFQARILEWAAISYSRGSSCPGTEPASCASPALAGRLFTTSATWEAHRLSRFRHTCIICNIYDSDTYITGLLLTND